MSFSREKTRVKGVFGRSTTQVRHCGWQEPSLLPSLYGGKLVSPLWA